MFQYKGVQTRKIVEGKGLRVLVEGCGMSKEEADTLARKMVDVHEFLCLYSKKLCLVS